MGEWVHRLIDKDLSAKTGTCAVCGPVRLKITIRSDRPNNPINARCLVAYKATKGKRYKWKRRPGTGSLPTPRLNCAICKTKTKLSLDHDHSSGRRRGWLCPPCNVGLGMFKDSPSVLAAAIVYLENK